MNNKRKIIISVIGVVISITLLTISSVLAEEEIITPAIAITLIAVSAVLVLIAIFYAAKVDYETGVYELVFNVHNTSNKELKYANSKMTELEQNLNIGNIQPAIVYTTHPLQIACYTEDFDNIFMLEFPKEYVSMYDLHEGDHLLTSTVFYKVKMTKYDDILPGF